MELFFYWRIGRMWPSMPPSGGPVPNHQFMPEGTVSTSQAVAQHLPYLRRYARALTGNQSSGDAYVATTLEALIEDPSVLDQGASTRVALYRLFTKIWNSVPLNGSAEANADEMPIEHRL